MKICWQHQVNLGRSNVEKKRSRQNSCNYTFSMIDYDMAKDFIEQYEWVGNMGTSKYCFGLFFNSDLGGVVCFGACVSPTKYSRIFGCDYGDKIIQLTRGASTYWAPKWCASKIISLALGYLRKNTEFRIVIAYADPNAGEVGTIYQACNFHYFGMTDPGGGRKYIIFNHIYDPRKVVAKFGSRDRDYISKIDPSFRTFPINAKHRYVYFLGSKRERKNLLKKISTFISKYPKRGFRI